MGKSSSKLSAENSIASSSSSGQELAHDGKELRIRCRGHNRDFSHAQLTNILNNDHLLAPFLTDIFFKEVEVSDCMQTLFRGNCLASKIMSICFRTFGSKYLKQLLEPHVKILAIADKETTALSRYEIDPTRLEGSSNVQSNRENLLKLTQEILNSILTSTQDFPPQLSTMCTCLRQVLCEKYPEAKSANLKAVGTVIFLRFINPAIVSPYEAGIVDKQPPPHNLRGLKLVSKILQNIANNVEFSKEEHMLPLNDFVRAQFGPMRQWVDTISSGQYSLAT